MSWIDELRGDPQPWLLDESDPGPRYLAMRDLLGLSPGDPSLLGARRQAHEVGPINEILANMQGEGYWVERGAGYSPKYRSTVWSIIYLSQLGASVDADPRIGRGCTYLLSHALTEWGQFSATGTPGATADCLQGNLCAALLDLGFADDRLALAFDWMARTVTGEGIAPLGEKSTAERYYSGKCGPGFLCGANNKLPCAWGAVKVMLAFSKLPREQWTPQIARAIEASIEFLFGENPATAAYPCGWAKKPSRNWWKFGFPVFYVTDVLQIAEALVGLGYGRDPRLADTVTLIQGKQDEGGRWSLDYDYGGKTWVDIGDKKQPNKWVTIRALRVLKRVYEG